MWIKNPTFVCLCSVAVLLDGCGQQLHLMHVLKRFLLHDCMTACVAVMCCIALVKEWKGAVLPQWQGNSYLQSSPPCAGRCYVACTTPVSVNRSSFEVINEAIAYFEALDLELWMKCDGSIAALPFP